MLRLIKTYALRLIIILPFISIISSCQTIRENPCQTIAIQEVALQPIGQITAHVISLNPSSNQTTHWKSYTNINWVTQIALDRSGNVWTAGPGGIARWSTQNGTSETFNASNGLPGNYITALAVGADNKIWLGTHSGQIVEYSNNKFSTLQKSTGDIISNLATSADGILWIGTNRGVYRYDGKNLQNYSTNQGIPDNYIQSIAVSSQGTVWVGVMGGVSFYDGENWKSKQLIKGEFISNIVEAPDKTIWLTSGSHLIHYNGQIWTTYLAEEALSDITTITISSQGAIWLGSVASGLLRFEEEKKSFLKYPISNISSMVSNSKGNLWLGTFNAGIAYFDGRDLDIYQPKNTPVSNFVTSSALSQDGSLWFGTDQGISKYDGEIWQSYTKSDGLVDDSILSIAASPDGSIWFCAERGLSHFDGNSWKTYNSSNGLPSNRISSIAVTRNGTAWLVSQNNLFQFDGSNWNSVTKLADLPIDSIKWITTGADGNLWVITADGVLRFDGSNLIGFHFPDQETTSSLAISNNGDLWIGTLKAGIIVLDGNLWGQIATENVLSVSLDPGGQVNVTSNLGVHPINGVNWRMFSVEDGLPSNTIKKILISETGETWVATDRGISGLNGDNKWKNFTERNGLGSNYVQTLVFDKKGAIWAGMSLGGMSEYVP